VEERLALLERLKRKHGPGLADVIATRDRLKQELADLEAGDDRLITLERECRATRERYLTAARDLSSKRRRAAVDFGSAMVGALTELAMEQTRFEARLEARDEIAWTAQGIDDVEFYLSPNPGEELRPLARIVSGGELSRIMLAIKTLVAGTRHGFSADAGRPPSGAAPGLIFDEVDAGIGGRVADVVGRRLRTLGSAFQVLCITHLPQIAACADTHFQIEKRVVAGRTQTRVTRLDAGARVDEISRMLGGAGVTDAIRASAREMLERRTGGAGSPGAFPTGRKAKAKGESERANVGAPGPRAPKPH
jgi:DNA repair protein RecN (Recombination protein N)